MATQGMKDEIEALKGQLSDLKGQLDNALDPEAARKLKDEIRKTTAEFKNLSSTAKQVKVTESNVSALDQAVKALGASLKVIGPVAIGTFAGLSALIKKTTEVSSPVAFQRWELTLRDLSGVVGSILTPVLRELTASLRAVADWIHSLDPATKQAIADTVSFTLKLTALLGVVYSAASAFSALGAAAAAVGLGLGPFLGVLSGVVTLAAAVASSFDQITGEMNAFLTLIEVVSTAVGSLVGMLVSLVTAGLSYVLSWVEYLSQKLLDLINLMRQWVGLSRIETKRPLTPEQKQSSVGAGGRNVGFASGLEVYKEVFASAFKGGTEDKAAARAEAQRDRQISVLERIDGKLVHERSESWDRDRSRHP